VIGVLIFEDLVAVLLIAILTAFSAAGESPTTVLPKTALQLIAFLAAIVLIGFFVVPRSVRAIVKLNDAETLLVFGIGICMGFAFLAQKVGYSVALGSFLAGALVAESGQEKILEHLLIPVRDLFAAIFFISIGMLVDPALLLRYWLPILVLTLIVVVGKIVSVTLGAFLTGNDVRTSVQSGFSMAQIGEFSFIIASAGLALGAIREFLFPVAIAVSVITTFITPGLIRLSGKIASSVDQHLPQPIQTFVTLYTSWIERARTRSHNPSRRRRLILIVLVDTLLLIIIIIGTSVGMAPLVELVEKLSNVKPSFSKWLVIGFACLLAAPFLIGMIRAARALGLLLAEQALPSAQTDKVDMAEAPRNLMVITLEYGMVLVLTIVILAATQPFLPAIAAAVLVLGIAVIAAVVFWQRASNLQGHVRAGGEMIIEALAKQSRSKSTQPEKNGENKKDSDVVGQLQELLPGLGTLHQVELNPSSGSIGKSLSNLNLHSLTGATVIAIIRQTVGVVAPGGSEILREGDILALIGTQDAVRSAKDVLLKEGGSMEIPPLQGSKPQA
jgi:CPA2 family monovalent cation:H+ antiporter-2